MKKAKLIFVISLLVIAAIGIVVALAAVQDAKPNYTYIAAIFVLGMAALAALFFVGLTGPGGGE